MLIELSVGLLNRHRLDFTLARVVFGTAKIGLAQLMKPGATALPGNFKRTAFHQGGTVFISMDFTTGRPGLLPMADQAVARLGARDTDRRLGVLASLVYDYIR